MKVDYSVRTYHKRKNVCIKLPATRVNYHDLTICINGRLDYEIDGKKIVLNSSDMIYIAPNNLMRRFENNDPCFFISINLYGDSEPLLDKHFYRNVLSAEVMSILNKLDEAHNLKDNDKLVILTLYLILEIKSQNKTISDDLRISKMKGFIINHVYDKITNEDIAKHIGYSTLYCETLFKKHTGKTLNQFITETKIAIAIEHMTYDKISLTKIAFILGFCDYNYFSRCFKKITGLTPSVYIKKIERKERYPTVPV